MVTEGPTQAASGQVEQLVDRLKRCFVNELEEVGPDAGARLLRLFDVWRQVSLRRIVDVHPLRCGPAVIFRAALRDAACNCMA